MTDTVEAIKAVSSLKALSDSKAYPVDLTIGDGEIVLANLDDKGQTELSADTDGELKVRLDGSYLAEAFKAFGGTVDLKLTTPTSPVLFSLDSYQLVVMPMLTEEAKKAEAEKTKPEAEKKPAEPEVTEAEPQAEDKPKKAKRSRAKEPLAAGGFTVFQLTMTGTFVPFVNAFGPHQTFHAGHSVHCGLGQHSIANCSHGAFRNYPDYEYCNYCWF